MSQHFDPRSPFTRARGLSAGLSWAELRSPRFRCLHRGNYISADVVPDPLHLVRSALLVTGEAGVASHGSAARVFRLPVPDERDEHVTVALPEQRRRRDGVRVHLGDIADARTVQGIRVTSPAQTFRDLTGQLTLVDLVVLGDAMLRRGLASVADLRRVAQGLRGARRRLARRAVGLMREGVRSPMETRVRLLLVLAGIPEPLVNYIVRDDRGDVVRMFDLYWPEAGVVVEYDGRGHIVREGQWESDLLRREGDEDAGLRVVVLVAKDIYRSPGKTVRRVFDVLRARGCPGLPPRPSEEWRAHFGERRAA